MCQHEQKYCPRCSKPFECKVGSILLCHCSQVILTDEQQNFIGQQYEDCLCINCLAEIKNIIMAAPIKEQLKGID